MEEAADLAELRLAAQFVPIEAGVAIDAVEEDQRACRGRGSVGVRVRVRVDAVKEDQCACGRGWAR